MKLYAMVRTAVAAILISSACPAITGGTIDSDSDGPRRSAPNPPKAKTIIRGIKVYDDAWQNSSTDVDAGIYTIAMEPGYKTTCIKKISSMVGVKAAVEAGSTMYCLRPDYVSGDLYINKYSTTSWNSIGYQETTDISNLPSDLTYNPVTSKVYGFFWDADEQGYRRFGTYNTTYGEASIINPAEERDGYAIASTPGGTLYCLFGAYNYLATVDATTGAINRIGTTHISPSDNDASSMVYDPENNVLYAIVTEEPQRNVLETRLYQIDPATGTSTLLQNMPGNALYVGLQIVEAEPAASAPAIVENVEFTATAKGTGVFTFKAPSAAINGAALNEPLMVIIRTGSGAETVIGSISPGSTVTTGEIEVGEGDSTVRFIACTDTERGAALDVAVHCEYTEPKPEKTYELPFVEPFDTFDDFDYWTIENTNGGSTWTYDTSKKAATYKYDSNKLAADDWIFSPNFELKAGVPYSMSYDAWVYSKSYPESFDIGIASAPNAASVVKTVSSHHGITNTSANSFSRTFTVEADGFYHIAIHCVSASYMWQLFIDNVGMREVDTRTPAAIDNLTVTPADEGALSAGISFTAPANDVNGEALTEKMTITLNRNGLAEPIATFADTAPGTALTFTDNTMSIPGEYTYSVTVTSPAGTSDAVTAAAWVGTDAPGPVENLVLRENEAGHPAMNWDAPAAGAHMGWFDPATLTYRIVRSDGEVVAESLTTTSFTDEAYTLPANGQDALWYLVTPYCGGTKGTYATTELVLFGSPYAAPFKETFANADMNFYPWVTVSDESLTMQWTMEVGGTDPVCADQNGDGGLAAFHAFGQTPGGNSYFYSPKINIAGTDEPELSFWVYHSEAADAGTNETLTVMISLEGGDFRNIEGMEPIMRDCGSTGWKRHSVSLADYKDATWLRVGFCGTTAGGMNIFLDNISIDQAATVDIELSAVTPLSRVAQGVEVVYEATVTNIGNSAAEAVRVSLTNGDEILAGADITALGAGESATASLATVFAQQGTQYLTVTVSAPGDENDTNNTAELTTSVVAPAIPAPSDLTASVLDAKVNLEWTAAGERGAVTDDFEAYADFAIAQVGGWKMVDLDFASTVGINMDGFTYPYMNDPKAWQVCNAEVLGINIWDEGKPHSGNKMMMALASQFYTNDDWLISPRLNGGAQTVRFFAKSFTDDNTPAERMRVLYSTTGSEPAHFTKISMGDYLEVPALWTEYSFVLPEGSRYFAINCVSAQSFALFVDDACFNDMTVPVFTQSPEYEIWNGNELAGTTSETHFELDLPQADAVYTVRARYADLTSDFSNEVYVKASGVENIETEAAEVRWFNLQGIRIDNPSAGSLYIRRQGNVSAKVRF